MISCPEAAKWLIALCSGCSPWHRIHLLPRATQTDRQTRPPHLWRRGVGRTASGCFCLDLGASAGLPGTGRGWRGIVERGRRANSCEVSRMVRQGARKRSVAGCQGWEHTEPCLKPGHAPSTGAERGWVKGYKKGGVGQSRKEGMQTRREEQIVQTIINPVFVLD